MLQKVELLVLGGSPEILPLVGGIFLVEAAFLVDDEMLLFLPNGGLVSTML
jgi:hypothetical protein